MTIEWSARAQSDAALLYAYIAADDEAAARNVLVRLYTAIRHLVQYPSMGRLSRDPRYRELIIDQYVVVYSVRRDRIPIIRVWHGAQRK